MRDLLLPNGEHRLQRYGGCGDDDVAVVLFKQPLLHHLHVKHPQKAAAQPSPERAGLRVLHGERAVFETKPRHRMLEMIETWWGRVKVRWQYESLDKKTMTSHRGAS